MIHSTGGRTNVDTCNPSSVLNVDFIPTPTFPNSVSTARYVIPLGKVPFLGCEFNGGRQEYSILNFLDLRVGGWVGGCCWQRWQWW